MELKRANALFGGQHQVANFEPRFQRAFGILKNRVRDYREAIAILLSQVSTSPVSLFALSLPLLQNQLNGRALSS